MKKRFSVNNPFFPLIWDATMMNDLSACAFRYRLRHLEGFTLPDGDSTDLEFGSAVHKGLEVLVREIVAGKTHDEAVRLACRAGLAATWRDGMPTLGGYLEAWRCTGTEPYRNEKGNRAKCPWSHKGKLFPGSGNPFCACGSPTESGIYWFADDPAKDRVQVLRVITWYAERLKGGVLRPVTVEREDGTHEAMVEINRIVDIAQVNDEVVSMSLNWDSVKQVTAGEGEPPHEVHVCDYKTSQHSLSDQTMQSFSPSWQVDMYDLGAQEGLGAGLAEHYGSVMIEGIQVGVGWCRFGIALYRRTPEQRYENHLEVLQWIRIAKMYADTGIYPRNRASCKFCQFRQVCDAPSSSREKMLEEKYIRSFWNPVTRTNGPPDDSYERRRRWAELGPPGTRGNKPQLLRLERPKLIH